MWTNLSLADEISRMRTSPGLPSFVRLEPFGLCFEAMLVFKVILWVQHQIIADQETCSRLAEISISLLGIYF